MDQKSKKGMWLFETKTAQKAGYGWILQTVSALLVCVVLILTAAELTGFDRLYTPWVMVLVSGCLCAVYGILTGFCRQRWFYPAVFFVILILVLFFRRQLLDGICLFWNQMGDTWTSGSGSVLPELETMADVQDSRMSLFLFSVLLGMVSALMSCGITACRVPVQAPLLSGLMLAGMIVFHQDRSFSYMLPVLLAAIFLMISGVRNEKYFSIAALVGRLVPLVFTCVFLLWAASVPEIRDWAAGICDDLQEKVHIHRYETEYTTLPEGSFSDYQEKESTDQPALVVNMEIPEEMYLRGFTGAVFEDDTWTALNPQVLAENEELLYWLNLNEFNPNAQYEMALTQTQITKNTVTVQNMGACSRYLYVPFNLCAGSYLEPENLSSDGVLSDGERIYVFSSISGATKLLDQTLENLQTSEEEDVLNYRKAESAYRDFVYRYYLQIPQDVTDMLKSSWDEAAAQYGTAEELTSMEAQECALAFLNECFAEDGKTEDISLPLKMAAKSSYQYATVAALTLRYFGIPARYAEGYIITEEMAAAAGDGGSIEADSSCASGWVEVYQDGIGWIPMDLTSGMEGLSEEEDNGQTSNEQGPKELDLKEGEELEETPDDVTEEPEPSGGYMVTVLKVMIWSVLLILGLLILLIVLLVLRHRLLLSRRKKCFDAESKKDAVAWIFADCVRLLEKLGFCRGNGSMQELCGPIQQRFGDAYAAEFEHMVHLNSRAMFSSREMDNLDRESAMTFRTLTLQHLKSNRKWYQKMWMQWILCLY